MSAARRNLKEADGKPPARRTETPYEARDSWMSLPNKAKFLLPKAVQSKWGGLMEGKTMTLPGEACRMRWVTRQPAPRDAAEPTGVSRGHSTGT